MDCFPYWSELRHSCMVVRTSCLPICGKVYMGERAFRTVPGRRGEGVPVAHTERKARGGPILNELRGAQLRGAGRADGAATGQLALAEGRTCMVARGWTSVTTSRAGEACPSKRQGGKAMLSCSACASADLNLDPAGADARCRR